MSKLREAAEALLADHPPGTWINFHQHNIKALRAALEEEGEPAGDAITTLRAIRDRHLEFIPRQPTTADAKGSGWYDDPENWRPKQADAEDVRLLNDVAEQVRSFGDIQYAREALARLDYHRAAKKGGTK